MFPELPSLFSDPDANHHLDIDALDIDAYPRHPLQDACRMGIIHSLFGDSNKPPASTSDDPSKSPTYIPAEHLIGFTP
jgi:hypothetical protein